MRQLGIPTVVDRLVQQAITQALEPLLDPTSRNRASATAAGRSAHDAPRQARAYVADGRVIVVDLDLEKFFDWVNDDILMSCSACASANNAARIVWVLCRLA